MKGDVEVMRDDGEREVLLARAESAVASGAALAQADPRRPRRHFIARSGWLNDPNGMVYHNGWHHLFYQHHPYSDRWDMMHWGHARSVDLVHWEHEPIGLWPSLSRNEAHCFSGSAVVDDEGRPWVFYTSIDRWGTPSQWAAVGDADLRTWTKLAGNPLLTLNDLGGIEVADWRDPMVFREAGWWWMVTGGHERGGRGCVFLHRSHDLVKWDYVGVAARGSEGNWECPQLFPLDGRWVLLYSPHNHPRWWVGDLDLGSGRFEATANGLMDVGTAYAPQTMVDKRGKRVAMSWLMECPAGRGWNGCMTIPRELRIDGAGRLAQRVVGTWEGIRGRGVELGAMPLRADTQFVLPFLGGPMLDLEVDLEVERSSERGRVGVGVRLLAKGDGSSGIDVEFDGWSVRVDGRESQVMGGQWRGRTTLRIIVDVSVVEVLAEGFAPVSIWAMDRRRTGVAMFGRTKGVGGMLHGIKAWRIDGLRGERED